MHPGRWVEGREHVHNITTTSVLVTIILCILMSVTEVGGSSTASSFLLFVYNATVSSEISRYIFGIFSETQ